MYGSYHHSLPSYCTPLFVPQRAWNRWATLYVQNVPTWSANSFRIDDRNHVDVVNVSDGIAVPWWWVPSMRSCCSRSHEDGEDSCNCMLPCSCRVIAVLTLYLQDFFLTPTYGVLVCSNREVQSTMPNVQLCHQKTYTIMRRTTQRLARMYYLLAIRQRTVLA